MRLTLPRDSLLCIYKSFVRPNLDYADVIYDSPSNELLSRKIESVQYNAALAITGAIRGTSRSKLYAELGLEELSKRRFCRRLLLFYKIINGHSSSYLKEFIPTNRNISYNLRNPNLLDMLFIRTKKFEDSFFPFCSKQWNELDPEIRNIPSLPIFKKALLKMFRPLPASIFNVHNPYGIMLLSRLRLDFSHLNEHLFRHNFSGTNPLCLCLTNSLETTSHFLLHCPTHAANRQILFDNLHAKGISVIPYNDTFLSKLLLFGFKSFNEIDNKNIICSVIDYLMCTKRFNGSLF